VTHESGIASLDDLTNTRPISQPEVDDFEEFGNTRKTYKSNTYLRQVQEKIREDGAFKCVTKFSKVKFSYVTFENFGEDLEFDS